MQTTGNRFIAEMLAGYGVTHVFFVPAGTYDILAAMEGLNIKRVLVHSEKAAAYMADGYARVSGRPGICMSQASPGANNLAAGLGDPYCGVSPIIAITSAHPPEERNRHAYQELDQMQFFAPVTKYNVSVDRSDRIPDLLRQAFREATSGSPRPVHLDVSMSAAAEDLDQEVVVEEQFRRAPAFRPGPEKDAVWKAAQLLKSAERPVIVAGGGVITSEAWPELVELAEKLAIPVATSLNGKGAIAGSHPLCIGVCGFYSRRYTNDIVCAADLVLFVGTLAGGQVTKNWTVPPAGTTIVQIDIEPTELGRNYPNCASLLGDAKVSLRSLIDSLGSASKKEAWAQTAHDAVESWHDEVRPLRESQAVPIRPERLCGAIEQALPGDAVLVSDTGHSGIWTGTMIDLKQAGRKYLRAAGSLGWAFPAAMGARCALPNRPIVCFTGDGGFWYHLSELETAVRNNIKTVTILNNNSSMSQETGEIRRVFPNGLPPDAYDLMNFSNVNLARMAEVMGCFGVRVEKPSEIGPALDQALASDRPALVDVVTDMKALPS